MTLDRRALEEWYVEAMRGRIEELASHREGLIARDRLACDAARSIGQALRGSGATFGFPALSAVAALVEDASDVDAARRVEGLIAFLQTLRVPQDADKRYHADWLARAAGTEPGVAHRNVADAWERVARESGLAHAVIAARAAGALGLAAAKLEAPSRGALRLVPEALMRDACILPVREDAKTVTVAAADPTSLTTEMELTRLTGRRPIFEVASPHAVEAAQAEVLGEAPAVAASASRPARPSGDGDQPTVLLVDDDAAARLLARTILSKRGYRVMEACDGSEAMALLRDPAHVSVVVADLNMPRMDGLELIWELRELRERDRVPVIVVTGETDEVLETKLIEEGADDYIRKPLDPRLFVARVGATIRRAEDHARVAGTGA